MNRAKRLLASRLSPETYHKLGQAKHSLVNQYSYRSYSQSGEDLILRQIFVDKADGFYVDVGAHHPKRYSNTFYFYTRGWRGINIDAMPGSMKAFQQTRPHDINLELGISENEGEMTFYVFNEPALNTFDAEVARQNNKEPFRVVNKVKVRTLSLANVLNQYLPQGQHIDFLSIDVEGLDLVVLKSNNWAQFRTDVILVESHDFEMDEPMACDVYRYLIDQGYKCIAKTTMTLVFDSRG